MKIGEGGGGGFLEELITQGSVLEQANRSKYNSTVTSPVSDKELLTPFSRTVARGGADLINIGGGGSVKRSSSKELIIPTITT